MQSIAWITAVFGALVVGVAVASVIDELLGQAERWQAELWSQEAIVRAAVTAVVALIAMAVWVWLWMRIVT